MSGNSVLSARSSRRSSKSDQTTVEDFSVRAWGPTIMIVLLLIALGTTGWFLWKCRQNASKAITTASASA